MIKVLPTSEETSRCSDTDFLQSVMTIFWHVNIDLRLEEATPLVQILFWTQSKYAAKHDSFWVQVQSRFTIFGLIYRSNKVSTLH